MEVKEEIVEELMRRFVLNERGKIFTLFVEKVRNVLLEIDGREARKARVYLVELVKRLEDCLVERERRSRGVYYLFDTSCAKKVV